jgi:hypothetical protein
VLDIGRIARLVLNHTFQLKACGLETNSAYYTRHRQQFGSNANHSNACGFGPNASEEESVVNMTTGRKDTVGDVIAPQCETFDFWCLKLSEVFRCGGLKKQVLVHQIVGCTALSM